MASNRIKFKNWVIRLLFFGIVFLLIATAGANHAIVGGFNRQPEQGCLPEDAVQPPEDSSSHDVADPAPATSETDCPVSTTTGLDAIASQPEPGPNCDVDPAPVPTGSPAPSPASPPAAPSSAPEPVPVAAPEEPVQPPASQPASRSGPAPDSPLPAGEAAGIVGPVEAQASPVVTSAPFTLGAAHSRNLRLRIEVTNSGDNESREIRIEMPLLGKLNSPYQVVLQETFSHTPSTIDILAQGSRIGHFYINALAPGSTVTLIIDYALRVHSLTSHFDAYSGSLLSSSPGYLHPSLRIESDHPRIVARAGEITAGKTNDLEKTRAIFEFVQRHMRHDFNSPHRNQGALSALETATGVCEDYATLFVALCRASGIPARQVNGYADPRGTGEIFNNSFALRGYRHSWAEFYLEGMGWLPADPAIFIGSNAYFGSLPGVSHIAQNYQDQPMRVKFTGGQLAVTWEELLVQN